jgi:hypothetical protein
MTYKKEAVFIRMNLKIKIKHSFLLLEALIAISLLLGVSIGFLEIQKYTIKKIKHQAHVLDAHIAYHVAISELFQAMNEQRFHNAVKAKKASEEIKLVDAPDWTCEFEFAQVNPDEIKPDDRAYKVEVTIKSLKHQEWGEYQDEFSDKSKKVPFCIEK